MQDFFRQLLQGISLESTSQQTIRLLEQQQQQFLASSQPQAAQAIASSPAV